MWEWAGLETYTYLEMFLLYGRLIGQKKSYVNLLNALMQKFINLASIKQGVRSRESVVGIAICYGLEGPGIESRWR